MKVEAIEETHINESRGHLISEPFVTDDPFTDDPGELFRYAQKEWGRCTGKVYMDTEEGTKAVGWVFQKTDHYEDTNEPYLHETWVTLLAAPDEREVTVKRTYYEIR